MTYIPNQRIIVNGITEVIATLEEKYFSIGICSSNQEPLYCIIQKSTGAIIGSYCTPFFALSAYLDIIRLYRYNDSTEPSDEKSFKIINRIIRQTKATEDKDLALGKYWVI